MTKILFLIVAQLSFSAYAQSAQTANPLCQEKGAIYSPVIEMAKGGKRILMLGFKHDGPIAYFDREQQAMTDWIALDSTNVSILTELYTCKTGILEFVAETKITGDQLEKLNNGLDRDASFVMNLLGDSVSKRQCQLDVDGQTYRPASVVDRNHMLCAWDNAHGMVCQWAGMHYPQGANIVVRSGDLVLDQSPAGWQAYTSLGIADVSPKDPADTKWSSAISKFNEFAVGGRSQKLITQILLELQSADRVVVPWGALHLEGQHSDHSDGLTTFLEQKGFKVVNRSKVLFADSADQTLSPATLANVEQLLKQTPQCTEKQD